MTTKNPRKLLSVAMTAKRIQAYSKSQWFQHVLVFPDVCRRVFREGKIFKNYLLRFK